MFIYYFIENTITINPETKVFCCRYMLWEKLTQLLGLMAH